MLTMRFCQICLRWWNSNGFTTLDNGNRTTGNFEAVDLVNFGSTDSGTVLSAAAGMRYELNRSIQFGAGYRTPISGRKDIMDKRYYFDMILSF